MCTPLREGHLNSMNTYHDIAHWSYAGLDKWMIELVSDVASDTVSQDCCKDEGQDCRCPYTPNNGSCENCAVCVSV